MAAGVWWARQGPVAQAPAVVLPDGGDTREWVVLSAEQRAVMQHTMRTNVEALDGILSATARSDLPGIAAAARLVLAADPTMQPSGSSGPSLLAVLPPAWLSLGGTVHQGLGALAADADGGRLTPAEVPGRLATITAACVACHQRYRYQ